MGLNFGWILTIFFTRDRRFGSVYCSQGVTRMTLDPNVSIAHVQEIVLGFDIGQKLHPGSEKLSVKVLQ